ncbi:acyl-CoA synthetase family member 2, mitochondrial [Sipha flava]|uniref:Medium-chain acyl-CoA ligase ACSF2, mitochondrial n=2 Tax=Sipha flava TaxID=143950 RepID=A0A2S2R8E7_9HEMI|nr:acyl-CoA synthetase family member 2, mitochondrial [Sipha flava]
MTNSLFKITRFKGLRDFNRHLIIRVCVRNTHWSKYSYLCGASSDPLKAYTIAGIFDDAVQKTPDRECLVSCHENKRFTFTTMHSEVDKLCKSFNAIGLTHGDRVGVWLPNYAIYYTMILAVARLGLVLVNINPAYQSDELKYSANLVGIKCLVALEKFKSQNYPKILENVDPEIFKQPTNSPIKSKMLPTLETVVFITENHINGAYNLESFLDLGSNTSYSTPNIQPDEGCSIQFTSGTTGRPKAAVLSHFGVINNSYYIMKRFGIRDDTNEENVHKFCCTMPLFHTFGLSAGIIAPIITKSTVYLPTAHFEPKTTVDVLTKEKCTIFFGTPTLYVDIMSVFEKLLPEQQQQQNIKVAITGGAPSSPALMTKFKKMFPDAKLLSVFGMTESSPCTFQNFYDDTDQKILSTVGHVQEHVEAKVVDSNGQMVPFGTPGELLVRGYVVMNGYYNNEEKTKEIIDSNGWLHTGDQFVMYEDGYGNYVGRLKEMIIRGGENIFPKEIEYFFESHPLILHVQVYGVPDQRMGEEICASVIVKEGSAVTESELKAYCKGKIAHFKIPKYIFIEKDEFPKTGSGKVQKYKLTERALKRITSHN